MVPERVVPVPDALRVAQVDPPLPHHADTDGEVATLVQQLHPLHLTQLDLKKESRDTLYLKKKQCCGSRSGQIRNFVPDPELFVPDPAIE